MAPVAAASQAPFSPQFLSLIAAHAEHRYSRATAQNRVRRCRYLLRSLASPAAARDWFGFLTGDPDLERLYRAMPHLGDKWHRHYLRVDFDQERRLRVLRDHYELMLGRPQGRRLMEAIGSGIPLATVGGKHGERFALVADRDAGRTKEGEVVLMLTEGGERVCTIAGTCVREATRVVFAIGCMQGPWGGQGHERMKQVTKGMHGLRPRDTLLFAVQVLAGLLGAQGIVGVGSRRHVYRGRRRTRDRIPSDYYDRLWQELGGRHRRDGDFELPAVPTARPLGEYPSHKRAEARRRQTLKEEIRAQMVCVLE